MSTTTSGPFTAAELDYLRARTEANPEDANAVDVARLIAMLDARDLVIRQLDGTARVQMGEMTLLRDLETIVRKGDCCEVWDYGDTIKRSCLANQLLDRLDALRAERRSGK
jgi:hypothetical protein